MFVIRSCSYASGNGPPEEIESSSRAGACSSVSYALGGFRCAGNWLGGGPDDLIMNIQKTNDQLAILKNTGKPSLERARVAEMLARTQDPDIVIPVLLDLLTTEGETNVLEGTLYALFYLGTEPVWEAISKFSKDLNQSERVRNLATEILNDSWVG